MPHTEVPAVEALQKHTLATLIRFLVLVLTLTVRCDDENKQVRGQQQQLRHTVRDEAEWGLSGGETSSRWRLVHPSKALSHCLTRD